MRNLVFFLLLVLASFNTHAERFSNVYFFGDSLTDVGNVRNLSITPLPADSPYDPQGRASNGPIYADTLAAGLGFAATPSTAGGNDYAFGGARTRYQLSGPPFMGIGEQINTFTAIPGMADPNALYVVWGGANNLQDIIRGKTVDALGNPIPTLSQSVGDMLAGIQSLYDDGARIFLVPNVPDLGLTPRIREFGSAAIAYAHALSLGFNAMLEAALVALDDDLADIELITFDTYLALGRIVATPSAYGLTNVDSRCYTGDDLTFTGGGTVCATPETYLFWDGIHPTTTVHGILGRQMLAAIPEPGTATLIGAALLMLLVTRTTGRRRCRHGAER